MMEKFNNISITINDAIFLLLLLFFFFHKNPIKWFHYECGVKMKETPHYEYEYELDKLSA